MGVTVRILSAEGQVLATQLEPATAVEEVKNAAIAKLYPGVDSTGTSLVKGDQYKLIHIGQQRTLTDDRTVEYEKLQDNDVLMLVKRREPTKPEVVTEQDQRTPTLADITAATSQLPAPETVSSSRASPMLKEAERVGGDFQMDLRKIIISLISVMATLLHGNEDAELICKELHTRIRHRLAAAGSFRTQNAVTEFQPEIECTPMGIVHGLVIAKQCEFRPNQKAVEALMEMGFTDSDIMRALRACRNNKDQACEWLLTGGGEVIDDVETGLDSESHLFTSLVNNATVRLGLNSPKTLLAFLGILETPSSANQWLSDPEISPVLNAVLSIYHAEKHAVPEL